MTIYDQVELLAIVLVIGALIAIIVMPFVILAAIRRISQDQERYEGLLRVLENKIDGIGQLARELTTERGERPMRSPSPESATIGEGESERDEAATSAPHA